jgi:hypothetical protein
VLLDRDPPPPLRSRRPVRSEDLVQKVSSCRRAGPIDRQRCRVQLGLKVTQSGSQTSGRPAFTHNLRTMRPRPTRAFVAPIYRVRTKRLLRDDVTAAEIDAGVAKRDTSARPTRSLGQGALPFDGLFSFVDRRRLHMVCAGLKDWHRDCPDKRSPRYSFHCGPRPSPSTASYRRNIKFPHIELQPMQ